MTLTQTNRVDKFLDSYNFYSNNIDFRICSSKAIEKFKNVQSFQLNQIANGNFYFKKNRKEILLLKYDMWARWIYEIENLFIELSGDCTHIVEQDHVNYISRLSYKTLDKINHIILEAHKEYFDSEFSSIWIETHQKVFNFFMIELKGLIGVRFDLAFAIIIDTVIEMMQYTLIELHELNGLYSHFYDDHQEGFNKCELPFLIYSKLDKKHLKITSEYIIKERLNIYQKYFDLSEIFVKNYSDERINPELFDQLESTGIKINYKLNF